MTRSKSLLLAAAVLLSLVGRSGQQQQQQQRNVIASPLMAGSGNSKGSDSQKNEEDAKPELKFNRIQITVPPHRVFRFSFNPRLFAWERGDRRGDGPGGDRRPEYAYLPMTATQGKQISTGGLPRWIRYKYSPRHKAGFLYGTPGEAEAGGRFVLDVVATNQMTYETGLLKLGINVTADEGRGDRASFGVRLKIDNLNVEDVFDSHRLKNLLSLFKHRMWPQAEGDLKLARIASSLESGFRRPLIPSLKDGVVALLSSSSNFSQALFDLDRETKPLRKMPSCPRDFKRTSVERHFRAKGFGMDWCQFRLMKLSEEDGEFYEIGFVRPNSTAEEELEGADGAYETPMEPPRVIVPVPDRSEIRDPDSGEVIFNGTLPAWGDLGDRDFSGQYALILGTTAGAGIVLFALVFLLFCGRPCQCCSKGDGQQAAGSTKEQEYAGFHESLFLVLRDCVTCCKVREKEPRAAHVRADDDFHRSRSGGGGGGTMDRSRRATSVQRQTDTLRRLAKQGDVTPRLQTPAPGTVAAPYMPPHPPPPPLHITPNPMIPPYGHDGAPPPLDDPLMLLAEEEDAAAAAAEAAEAEAVEAAGLGGPVILLSDDGNCSLRSRGSSPGYHNLPPTQQHSRPPSHLGGGSRQGTLTRPLSRFDVDPLGSLPRPVPPPYFDQRAHAYAENEADRAYLV